MAAPVARSRPGRKVVASCRCGGGCRLAGVSHHDETVGPIRSQVRCPLVQSTLGGNVDRILQGSRSPADTEPQEVHIGTGAGGGLTIAGHQPVAASGPRARLPCSPDRTRPASGSWNIACRSARGTRSPSGSVTTPGAQHFIPEDWRRRAHLPGQPRRRVAPAGSPPTSPLTTNPEPAPQDGARGMQDWALFQLAPPTVLRPGASRGGASLQPIRRLRVVGLQPSGLVLEDGLRAPERVRRNVHKR